MENLQETRIRQMEQLLDRSVIALSALETALSDFDAALPELRTLFDYYETGAWRQDYDDDAAGKLPQSLKRGVLSQDAVYDLMTDYQAVLEQLAQVEAKAQQLRT